MVPIHDMNLEPLGHRVRVRLLKVKKKISLIKYFCKECLFWAPLKITIYRRNSLLSFWQRRQRTKPTLYRYHWIVAQTAARKKQQSSQCGQYSTAYWSDGQQCIPAMEAFQMGRPLRYLAASTGSVSRHKERRLPQSPSKSNKHKGTFIFCRLH